MRWLILVLFNMMMLPIAIHIAGSNKTILVVCSIGCGGVGMVFGICADKIMRYMKF